jgi:hypothetical protein
MDGMWAALNLLEEDFEITKWNIQNFKQDLGDDFAIDFVLGWGGFNSRVDNVLREDYSNYKTGLCLGGNAYPARSGYDVIFYETKWVRDELKLNMVCDNVIHAFGINTDIFGPSPVPTPIVWDYIGAGCLAKWKRWNKMSHKSGKRLVVGDYQTDNENESAVIAMDLIKHGVMVSDQVNPFDLVNYLHWSRTAYVPAELIGGGERFVLEARSCGLQVEVEDDNPKLKELLDCPIYDQFYYRDQLKKGILSVL